MRTIVCVCAVASIAGCVSADRSGNEDLDRYVEFCRETAMTSVGAEEGPA